MIFHSTDGVLNTKVGYAGGTTDNPTYSQVCSGQTGHAEVVKVEFDPNIIDFSKLLDIFWDIHDPTQINRQGVDIGTQYRSCIFTDYEPYIEITKNAIKIIDQSKRFDRPISTILYESMIFFEAENYHQKYLFK
ncbi:MAG: peptide-methionine (S)-S-oxide reductase [Hyphomicrobiales bacterium]|nr:MAG: peptide-methionine (S)-S-oxide reductase [Hyphomicrobiales bacterium]